MSMNLHLDYSENFISAKLGIQLCYNDHCWLWQTPTEVSYKIKGKDKTNLEILQAYFEWVKLCDLKSEAEEKVFNPILGILETEGERHIRFVNIWLEKYGIENVTFWVG